MGLLNTTITIFCFQQDNIDKLYSYIPLIEYRNFQQ